MFDINYLLWLQGIREKSGPIVEKIFTILTDIPFNPLTIVLICVIYWCLNKKMGLFILFSQTFGTFADNLIKLCACVYRPWIRDARINPPAKTKAGATGYSFPSGHSQTVMGLYGTLGYSLIEKDRKEKSQKWLWAIILCAVIIFIVAFSRNFLGVHTPQDVAVGLLLGLVLIFATDFLLKWEAKGEGKAKAEGKKNWRDLIVAGSGTLLIIICSIIFLLKSYPMDYDERGNLLVDPNRMRKDFFEAIGMFLAVLWGWVIEKRFIQFKTEGKVWVRIIRAVAGAVCLAAVYLGFSPAFKRFFGKEFPLLYVYYTIKMFVTYFVVVTAYPAAVMGVQKAIIKKGNAAKFGYKVEEK